MLRPVLVRLLDFTLDLIEAQQAIYEMVPEICEAYTQYIPYGLEQALDQAGVCVNQKNMASIPVRE